MDPRPIVNGEKKRTIAIASHNRSRTAGTTPRAPLRIPLALCHQISPAAHELRFTLSWTAGKIRRER
jgi:hypothetical protein